MKTTSEAKDSSLKVLVESLVLRNLLLERASLENFSIRYPGLMVHARFYYKYVECGEFEMGNHGHWHWEITRIDSGIAEYFIGESEEVIVPDSTHYLVIPPRTTHAWRTLSTPLQLNSWQIDIEPLDEVGEKTLETMQRTVEASSFQIKASAEQILTEEVLWQMAGRPVPMALFSPILCGYARIIIGDLLGAVNPWPIGYLDGHWDSFASSKRLAAELKNFLDENISHPIQIRDIEAHFHYTGRHINRIFKEAYKVSVGRYLREQRIDLAKQWLSTTNRAIKDIALSLGYRESSQFCRYFIKEVGLTPSEFRSRLKHS